MKSLKTKHKHQDLGGWGGTHYALPSLFPENMAFIALGVSSKDVHILFSL